jgi:hypothetical protein
MIGFNGTGLSLPPTEANWLEQDTLGITGNGRAVYPALREFEMTFNLSNQQNLYELWDYFQQISTGTVTATLPEYMSPVFRYKNYSGVILRQPTVGSYFAEEYTQEIRLVLLVRT